MTPTPTAAKVSPVVFVIDDDASVRAALSSLIRSVGLRVEVFASASEFLATKRTDDGPSCLILDVRLPGMSGLNFQAELAKTNAIIPIIFITGHGDIPMSVKAMKAGAVEFLTKPFRDQDLMDAIQVALERARSWIEREGGVGAKGKLREPFASREGGYGAGNWRPPQQANRCRTRSERGYRKGPSWQRNAENGS
jgi:FixJ family two-component response regulator